MKFLVIFLISLIMLNAKNKDFYYSFIDSNGKQISSKTKESIIKTLDEIERIKTMIQNGDLNIAFKELSKLKEDNKISMLNSDILILYSKLILKNQSKRLLIETSEELEKAINSSVINQDDLLDAYLLLVDLKLSVNKISDAQYYAQTIIDIFTETETKLRGKIALAKIFKYQKDYEKATKTLFEVLAKTKDKNIASIAGDELFNLYLLSGKKDEAKSLITQILTVNPSFYSEDFTLANQRADLFLKLDMPNFSTLILEELIKTSQKPEILEKAKYKLANIYMSLYDGTDLYLSKAKELYKNVVDEFPKSEYLENAQMYIDEIKMRQRILVPNVIAEKYLENLDMQNKALLQELINYNANKKYEEAVKINKIYREIPRHILKRFGYTHIDDLLDKSYIGLVKQYLNNKECLKLSNLLKELKYEIFKDFLDDITFKDSLIECVNEVLTIDNYAQLKNILIDEKDINVAFVLEKMALNLELIDDAFYFSTRIEKADNKNMLEKEFLYRYQILKIKNDSVKLDKYFKTSFENSNLIHSNENEPMIIDFYYDYYLYLLKEKKSFEALNILKSLNEKQNKFKVHIYSPFVETELAKNAKDNGNLEESAQYLYQSIQNTRNLKADDEVKIYYDIMMIYDSLGNKEKKDEFLQKCKNTKIEDNFYKRMCLSIN